VEEPHVHDFDEVIGFIGSNQDDPQDLGGQITIWLDNEEHVLTNTCLIFVPAGAKHCPIRFDRIDSPIFFTTMSPNKRYTRTDEKDGIKPAESGTPKKCTVIDEVKGSFGTPPPGEEPPKPPPGSNIRGARVMHLEDDVVEGSFYVDFVWIYEGNGGAPAPEHNHEWEELIAMAGCDPDNPNDLGGTMSIVLGDETHYITKSSLVCIPKNLKHCPWLFHDIKKPTLVFTAGPSAMYTGSHREGK
jgi:mannose-6-phosphate isomerase-like protein (cupin superfamily)